MKENNRLGANRRHILNLGTKNLLQRFTYDLFCYDLQ